MQRGMTEMNEKTEVLRLFWDDVNVLQKQRGISRKEAIIRVKYSSYWFEKRQARFKNNWYEREKDALFRVIYFIKYASDKDIQRMFNVCGRKEKKCVKNG